MKINAPGGRIVVLIDVCMTTYLHLMYEDMYEILWIH